jgi:hypothetical protein
VNERLASAWAAVRADRRFWIPVLLVALLGVGLRLAVVQAAEPCGEEREPGCFDVLLGDPFEYQHVARTLARGDGFLRADEGESAHHPPAMSVYLAGWVKVGVDGDVGLRRATALLGGVTIVVVAGVARQLGGRRVGVVAAVLAAAHPALWINDAALMSESVYQLAVVVVAGAGLAFWRRRSVGAAVGLGVACGVAALTRTEGALLAPLIAVPLALGFAGMRWRDRLGLVAAVGATSILVVAPWLHHNATRFEEPALMTTTAGQSLLLTNNPMTYYGPGLGSKSGYQLLGTGTARAQVGVIDESTTDARLVEMSAPFREANTGRLPVVVMARVARQWGLYKPVEMAQADYHFESRGRRPAVLSWWTHAAVAPLALAGLVVLWRRRLPVSPLLALVAAGTFTAAVNFGLTRYRAGADIALVIAAAVALVALWDAGRRRLGRAGP